MKNYRQKDGMLIIFRAMVMTAIALIVCWLGYRICRPTPKIQEYELKQVDRDLGDIYFETGPDGNFVRVH